MVFNAGFGDNLTFHLRQFLDNIKLTNMIENIHDFKTSLKGMPKETKLNVIDQELNNRGLGLLTDTVRLMNVKTETLIPSDEELEKLKVEIENNVEAYESVTQRVELIPFMYDRDLDWFFNVKNIPAQSNLVFPTYEYFNEGPGKGIFDPLDFFNLLQMQHKELLLNMDKPISALAKLKSIPLSERERHILLGFIIKWMGGYPVNNMNEQCNTVLKLVEKEFLAFPENTPEKDFCRTDARTTRQFGDIAAHLHANMKGITVITPNESKIISKYNFPESHYIGKIEFDFGELPEYIIRKGIIQRFEGADFRKDSDFINWRDSLSEFISTLPVNYVGTFLSKSIEYGQRVFDFHIANECTDKHTCPLNQSWERRLAIAKNLHNVIQLKSKNGNGHTEIASGIKGFVIHGHDQARKFEVARFIEEELKYKMTILHEQANMGKTVIEKFEQHAEVHFAVALWTADDLGKAKSSLDDLNARARQNVIFETGYFIGKIGRANVIVLYEDGVEMPSDYSGVIYISLMGNWKNDLRKELVALGQEHSRVSKS